MSHHIQENSNSFSLNYLYLLELNRPRKKISANKVKKIELLNITNFSHSLDFKKISFSCPRNGSQSP